MFKQKLWWTQGRKKFGSDKWLFLENFHTSPDAENAIEYYKSFNGMRNTKFQIVKEHNKNPRFYRKIK